MGEVHVRIAPLPPLRGSPSSRTLVVALLTVSAVVVAACGSDQSRGGKVPGDTLTVFSSLPLQGPEGERSKSIVNAEKLALRQAGGKAGNFKVNFAFTDDSTAGGDRPGWNPDKTAENARKAVQNPRTIAYIGDLDSEASAVSIPITNEAGFAQISPGSTSVGLTKLVPGAEKGEPDKFYPSGDRNFVRVVPADDVEASAASAWAKQLGARTIYLLGDRSVEGDGLAELVRASVQKLGLKVVGFDRADPRADNYKNLVSDVAKAKPDAVYFGGGVESNALRLWNDLHSALPGARLVGSHDLLVPQFYSRLGRAEGVTYLTSVAQDPHQLPARGQRFVRDYRRQFGEAPDPYAVYGYTAMALLLDALKRAEGDAGHRDKVIDELIDTNDYASPVGTFSIDDNGDTSLDRIAGYRIKRGSPSFAAGLVGEPSG
jgi:branched-chain amino acid transport system substrate-binding protein